MRIDQGGTDYPKYFSVGQLSQKSKCCRAKHYLVKLLQKQLIHDHAVQTSVCFGCGTSLKPGGQIGSPPADLVIVSNMHREWRQDGETRRKAANVYFHCILGCMCIRRKQPLFQPNQCILCHSRWYIFSLRNIRLKVPIFDVILKW